MKIGILGLGKMGGRIALKLHEENHEIIVWNRSFEVAENFVKSLALRSSSRLDEFSDACTPAKLGARSPAATLMKTSSHGKTPRAIKDIKELVLNLENPRVIWLMLPAGEPTDSVLNEVSKYLQKGDIVIDGGNAHFSDTQKRYEEFGKKGIEFLGIGVSGGILAAKNGYPLMVGGSKKAYEYIKPILDSLAKPNGGHEYFGKGGAGHFVKMVHNGIEYAVMQGLGEGFEVLKKSSYEFDLVSVAKLWQKGTLVTGFMLDRAFEALAQNPDLENMAGPVSESGEARWTVEEAKKENVNVEIIERSLDYRVRSQKSEKIQNSFTAKMINALRFAFGGHEVKK